MSNLSKAEIASRAAKIIEGYKSNKIIMEFAYSEAREKVAHDIRKEIGGGTTAKAVELLEMKYPNIAKRVSEYVDLALIGCFIAGQEAA